MPRSSAEGDASVLGVGLKGLCRLCARWVGAVSGPALMALVLYACWLTQVAAAPAQAIAMPFACLVDRGEVSLSPAPEQIYRIVGRREQHQLSLCPPSRGVGEHCRPLTVHRFVFDCDGNRVAWLDAARALVRDRPWSAKVAGGRMMLVAPRGTRGRPVLLPAGFAPAPDEGFRFLTIPGLAEAAQLRHLPRHRLRPSSREHRHNQQQAVRPRSHPRRNQQKRSQHQHRPHPLLS